MNSTTPAKLDRFRVFLWLFAALQMGTPSGSAAEILKQPRTYAIGLGYVTAHRPLSVTAAYDHIARAADIAYIQKTWSEWQRPETLDEVTIARHKGLKIYLALDLLSYSAPPRRDVVLADGAASNFSSPAVQAAYLQLVTDLVRAYQPDYVVPLVEANLHAAHNPGSYSAFKQWYPQVFQTIRRLSPGTRIGVSMSYADYMSPSGFGAEDREAYRRAIKDFEPYSDMVCASVYPFLLYVGPRLTTSPPLTFHPRPSGIPEDFFNELAGGSSLPLFISETSWVSRTFDIAGIIRIQSSPEDQSDYVARLTELAGRAQAQGQKIEAINFVSLVDPDERSCDAALTASGLSWFCSLALMNSTAQDKPAFVTMETWKRDEPYRGP